MLRYLCLLLLQVSEYEKDNEAPWIPPPVPVCSIDSKLKILWMVALFTAYGCANISRLQSSGEDYLHLFHILSWHIHLDKLQEDC